MCRDFAFIDREPLEIEQRQRHWLRRPRHLDRLPIHHPEGGSQDFMPCDDRAEAVLKRTDIQPSGETHGDGDAVDCDVRLQLGQEPQALLGERER